jgi:alpha-L-arabinofuranosidase
MNNKRVLLAMTIGLAIVCAFCMQSGAVETGSSTIQVTPSQRLNDVSPFIFGAAIEWADNGNGLYDAKTDGLRQDILDLLKPLRLSVLRFPGGILSDYYHWRDGVGNRPDRPSRVHPMEKSDQKNTFGTDEFIEVCKQLGAQPLITANYGTGTVDEALEWQSYFKSQNFPVHFWEIGNEIYLTEDKDDAPIPGNDKRIFRTAPNYASDFRDWARRLRNGDSDVRVGAIAGTYNAAVPHKNWLPDLLSASGTDIDFIALHNSFAPITLGKYDFNRASKRLDAYLSMFAEARFAAEDIRQVVAKFSEAGPRGNPDTAVTEHFPLFGAGGSEQQMRSILDQSRTLASALYTASLFHVYMREKVWMANYNIVTSKWFGALVTDTDDGLVRTPTYHVFDLYRNHFGSRLVDCKVSGPSFSTKHVGVVDAADDLPVLDAVASTDQDGSVYLAVINRSLVAPQNATVQVQGVAEGKAAEVRTLAGPAPNAINGPALSRSTSSGPMDNVAVTSSEWGSTTSNYTFPPSSLTVFRWKP